MFALGLLDGGEYRDLLARLRVKLEEIGKRGMMNDHQYRKVLEEIEAKRRGDE